MKQEQNTQGKIQDIIISDIRNMLVPEYKNVEINETTVLGTDLEMDSLDMVELLMECEKDFGIVIPEKDFEILIKTLKNEQLYKTIQYMCEIQGVTYIKPAVKNIDLQTKATNIKEAVAKMQNVRAITTNNVKQKKR